VKFEWDGSKESGNLLKHGVDFSSVPDAFGDPRRIFIRYPGMTAQETRWQLVGFDGNGILTVRFTLSAWMGARDRGWLLAQAKAHL